MESIDFHERVSCQRDNHLQSSVREPLPSFSLGVSRMKCLGRRLDHIKGRVQDSHSQQKAANALKHLPEAPKNRFFDDPREGARPFETILFYIRQVQEPVGDTEGLGGVGGSAGVPIGLSAEAREERPAGLTLRATSSLCVLRANASRRASKEIT